jgi:hypothetical protein
MLTCAFRKYFAIFFRWSRGLLCWRFPGNPDAYDAARIESPTTALQASLFAAFEGVDRERPTGRMDYS